MEHRLSPKNEQGSYIVYWDLIKSKDLVKAHGSAQFFPYKKNKTLLVYKTFTEPNSIFAGLFKKKALEDVKISLKAIVKHIQLVKQFNPEKLKFSIGLIENAQKGQWNYR